MNNFYNGIIRKNTQSYKWDKPFDKKIEGTLPFWIADSDYKTVDKVINDLKERVDEGSFGYTFASSKYYDSIKNFIKRHYSYDVLNDDIILAHGVVYSLSLIISLLVKSENITIQTPVYNQFYNVIKNNNCNVIENKMIEKDDTYEIDFVDLENCIKKSKMFILCNPHNPLGIVLSKEEIEKILNLCKKYNCILVSDEIHADIIFDGLEFTSLGRYFDVYENIIVLNAISKTFNVAGMMNSNIILKNDNYKKLINEYQNKMSLSTPNVLSLTCAQSCYENGDEYIDIQNKYLMENRDIVENYFKENLPKCKVYKLKSTYLMWINMNGLGLNHDELIDKLFEHKIHINSGTTYSNDYKGYIRLNIACGRWQLMKGLEYLKDLYDEANN